MTELPEPVAGPGQVVVRTRAVCVHPADVAATTGEIPRGPDVPPFLPGWDIAGEVASVGPDTAEFRVGDRVVGMIPWYTTRGAPGGYAEFVAADADWLVPLPDELDFVSAATVPLNAQTAHQGLSLVSMAMLPAGSSILVTGASGGVGGFATQLAAQGGYRVLAQASHGDEQWVRDLGAHEVVPRSVDLARWGRWPRCSTRSPSARRRPPPSRTEESWSPPGPRRPSFRHVVCAKTCNSSGSIASCWPTWWGRWRREGCARVWRPRCR